MNMSDIFKEEKREEGQNIIKASLFNLVVISHKPEHIAHLETFITHIVQKFPCRILFVRTDETGQSEYLHTSFDILSQKTKEHTVYCDLITINASSHELSKVPFLLLPHLQPDLPVYILQDKEPLEDRTILPLLEQYATRVLFEPEKITNLCEFAQSIQEYRETKRCEIIDINWAKTTGWRRVLAHVFATSMQRSHLDKAKKIQIGFSVGPQKERSIQEAEALYVQSWIASRMGWELISVAKENSSYTLMYKRDHTTTTVALVPVSSDLLEPGAIYSFELLTYDDFHILLSHENERKFVNVHASDKERCEMPYALFMKNYQSGASLINEIFYAPQSGHYYEALKLFDTPLWRDIV